MSPPGLRRAPWLALVASLLASGCYRSHRLPNAVAEDAGDAGPPPDAPVDASDGDRDDDGVPDDAEVGCLDPGAFDTDGDGISDGEELDRGLDPCSRDSDGDGADDLTELGGHLALCPDRPFDPAVPCAGADGGDFLFIRLRSGDAPRLVNLTHNSRTRNVDVFVLRDLPEGADRRPFDVALDAWPAIQAEWAETRVALGRTVDFPMLTYGEPLDAVLEPLTSLSRFEERSALRSVAAGTTARGGGDEAGAGVEALFRTATGAGEIFRGDDGEVHVVEPFADACGPGELGAPCFDGGGQAVIAFFPERCPHGAPGDAAGCEAYTGILPAPTSWEDAMDALRARDVRLIGGLAPTARDCDLTAPTPGLGACHFLDRSVRAVGSVRRDGRPLLLELTGRAADADAFARAVIDAVLEVRFDVHGVLEFEATEAFDPEETFLGFAPLCAYTGAERCWRPRPGLPSTEAVEALDEQGYLGVLDGTQLDFGLELVAHPEDAAAVARAGLLTVRFRRAALAERDAIQIVVIVEASPPRG